jgi:hypothetical protein
MYVIAFKNSNKEKYVNSFSRPSLFGALKFLINKRRNL